MLAINAICAHAQTAAQAGPRAQKVPRCAPRPPPRMPPRYGAAQAGLATSPAATRSLSRFIADDQKSDSFLPPALCPVVKGRRIDWLCYIITITAPGAYWISNISTYGTEKHQERTEKLDGQSNLMAPLGTTTIPISRAHVKHRSGTAGP